VKIDILTLFPGIFNGPFTESIIKRARESKIVGINIHDLRKYTKDKHRTADDKPYGGGSGMVMKPEPIFEAVDELKKRGSQLVLMTPAGLKFDQSIARKLSKKKHIIFICGHYEGVDERVNTGLKPLELSIGDYILTNGSLASAVVVDAIIRLIPGVLGNPNSTCEESFSDGFLEYPHYTRPSVYRGMKVPKEIMSGNHKTINEWRRKEAIKKTRTIRPDMINK